MILSTTVCTGMPVESSSTASAAGFSGATGTDLMRLAQAIMADVEAGFGVRLEPEPVFV